MKVNIREAYCSDLEEMQRLFLGAIKNIPNSDYSKKQTEAWSSTVKNKERWKSMLANQYVLIAEINSKIVGFGSLDKNYIDFMYVHKDFLRKGIASKIFEGLQNKSIELGYSQLTSKVSKTARPFFERKGFSIIKENKNIINGVEIINYKMCQ